MLENNLLPITSTVIIKKFLQIGRTNMFLLYTTVLICSFSSWISLNSNDSSCNKLCDDKQCEPHVFSVQKFRVLTEYNNYNYGSQSSLNSLEDMDDDEREECLQELISYYNVFLNYYPRLNTKDKIINIRNPELTRRQNYVSNGKDNTPQANSDSERSYGYDEVDNQEDVEDFEEFEILIETEPSGEADYLRHYLDMDIDIEDKELTALDGIYEEMSTFKRKYLEIWNKIITYINNLQWNSAFIHDYLLLFSQLNILITMFFLHMASPNIFMTICVVALTFFVL
ncbi:hypothetical protein AK88_02016 [Plasmodium fragile]|uniref:Uncharacterized protein n=1 Tax=Plasmodium fragile TaxID=5857 RepID=A0A0D9QMX3_PLAFR|nr:uncharacterized protein AK88_02016 [Plasmodium fragile]KJP88399.1 hypothetical protein AK88_02016 [Plasmodium fragile]